MALIGTLAINMKVMSAQFSKGMASARRDLNAMASQVIGLNRVMAMLTFAGAGVGLRKVAQEAMNVQEQTNHARIVFDDSASDITRQAQVMADAFGLTKSEFISAASDMGGMFKGAGYNAKQASQLAIHFTNMAIDASSALQISREEAMRRMQSGLAGEAESIRRWGVDITEANLKIRAQAMGMQMLGGELTQGQKIQVRMALITEKLAYTQGDLANTADQAQNAVNGLMGRLTNLAGQIGETLLPVIGGAASQLSTAIQALSIYWADWANTTIASGAATVGSLGETANAMGWLQKSIGFIADAWQTVQVIFYYVQGVITHSIQVLIENLAYLGRAFDTLLEKLTGFKAGVGEFLQAYSDDLKRVNVEQYKAFQELLTKPPAHQGIDDYFARAQERIKAMRTEAQKSQVDLKKIGAPAGAMTATGAPKFASAMTAGSKEATNAILRARYGAGAAAPKDKASQETAANTRKLVDLFRPVAESIGTQSRLMSGQAITAGAALATQF